jgi:hypothetical protein
MGIGKTDGWSVCYEENRIAGTYNKVFKSCNDVSGAAFAIATLVPLPERTSETCQRR